MRRLWLILSLLAPLGAQEQEPGLNAAAQAVETAPLPPALREQINQAMRDRDLTRAETILVAEIERNPKSPQLLTLLGGLFFLDAKYPNAVVALKKAERLAPLDESSRFTLAMGYVLLKRLEWARPELARLARDYPRNPLYLYWQARLDYDDQKFPAAVAKLRMALELAPEFIKAYDKLALCLEALGQLDEAVDAYKKAIELNRRKAPASAWPPLNLGSLLVRLARFEEAEPYLREALGYDPNFAQAHYQLGVLLEKQERASDAIEELKRAAALDPAYPEPQYALARIYRNQGETEQAARALSVFQRLKQQQNRASRKR